MSVIEQLSEISNAITGIMNFVTESEKTKDDFNEYLKMFPANGGNNRNMQSILIPYVFERKLFGGKSVPEVFLDFATDLTETERGIVRALTTSFSSVYEIEKVTTNGFELYNLLNEKKYHVLSLVKMNNYRGVHSGQFAVCRIFQYQDEFYLLEMPNVMPGLMKDEVYKFAVAKIIENPESAYIDNPKKIAEIENQVSELSKKFVELFGSDEVVTNNHNADNLINLFNSYTEENCEIDKAEIEKNIVQVEENKYFPVRDFQNSYDDFMEKSLAGFSVHSSTYDIGIIFDSTLGMFVIPFYQTFCKIYEVDDYTKIQGYKECVESFLQNEKLPADIIKRVMQKYDNFLERTNKILNSNYDEQSLFEFYKINSLNRKIFSSTSVLYASKIFSKVMETVTDKVENKDKEGIDYSNVGRNDLCPCGSGKKYKKCCLQRVTAQGK